MYKIAKIKFKPLIEKDDTLDKIDDVLSCLFKNGQILDSFHLEKHNGYYLANVITTDDNSLDSKYYNEYILKLIKEFEIENIIVCDDVTSTDCCHCHDHSFYVLAIDYIDESSPIICGDCGKEIPLYKIPYINNEGEHYSVLNFQRTYKSVVNLWIDGLSDRFTKRQITDHKSSLNQTGIDICKKLEDKLNKPVYYLLRNPIGCWFEYWKNNNLEVCPKCGKEFTYIDHSYIDKVCEDCRLGFITCDDED